jgi:A/G-specific adenine glycosylase
LKKRPSRHGFASRKRDTLKSAAAASRQQIARLKTSPSFAAQVVEWQRRHGRHGLPWQNTRDPYRVWLSEVMLQQTQVATVLGYYERFLQAFPDVAALAAAPLDDVLALWSGLGYYSRARNLHRCAQAVVAEHGGRFPSTSAALATLPGIGRSTAAAIAAFCFGERVAILDGNVKRVLTRVLGFGGDLAEAARERELWALATGLLPEQGIEPYTQGLMDLGATLCAARAPQCAVCPVHSHCVAAHAGEPERYPVKTRKLKRGRREHVWLWLQWQHKLWLQQRPDTGVWAGLWSLPEFDSPAAFELASATWPGTFEPLPSFTHTLTHLDWTLHPLRWTLPPRTGAARVAELVRPWPTGRWFGLDEALASGLPAPLRKLLSTNSS